jgi:hypothetical protein
MNQQPQTVSPYPIERGDELSLIELWKVLVEYKLLIIVFTALTTLGAIYYALSLPTIYKTQVLMVPSGGGTGSTEELSGLASLAGISLGGGSVNAEAEQAFARLKTRSFLISHIKEKNLKYILFADKWNKAKKQWIGQEPSDYKSFKLFNSMITAGSDRNSKANLASLTIEWVSPVNVNKIADIANNLIHSINLYEKQYAINEAKNSILFLEEELKRTSILSSQTMLYSLIEQQMVRMMIANVGDEFVFKILDPAIVPQYAEKKSIPVIIFIAMVLGIFFGSILAVGVNFLNKNARESNT